MRLFLINLIALFVCTQMLNAQTDQDEKAIRSLVRTMAEGWSEGSGEKFAGVFADQHDFVVWNGFYMRDMNPQFNARAHQQLFETQYRNTDHYATVDKIKFIREDLALIHVLAAVVPDGAGRPENPQVLWSGLLEKKNGEWKIISFHNLDLEVFENEQMMKSAPMPPNVMYASWYAEEGK